MTSQGVTAEDVIMILAYAAALDPRFNTSDSDQAQARVLAWVDVLAGVPPEFVLDRVRRWYRAHHDWSITPGFIRDAWLTDQRVEESKMRSRQLAAAPDRGEHTDRWRELVAQVRAEVVTEVRHV